MRPLLPFLLAFAATAQERLAPEKKLSATVDGGYRFLSGVNGDVRTYRSVVNLGEGPKLFSADVDYSNPMPIVLDRFTLSLQSWGGEPYNTLRLDAERSNWWRLRADYRNLSYYNFLPSFANPVANLNQRGFDHQRRYASVDLDLLPHRRISPYVSWQRDSGRGRGVTPYIANGNEYPVATQLDDGTHLVRGGLRFDLARCHLTLEQGGGTFTDNQRINSTDRNPGNRGAPIFDQSLFLASLSEKWSVEGRNYYSKGVLTAAPASWAHLYLHFIHSRPTQQVQYTDSGRGLFYLAGTRFFNGIETLLSSEAKMPRSSASAGVELRPLSRLRVVESWSTERLHNASSALLAELVLFASALAESRSLLSPSRLVVNYNRQQADAIFDLTSKVSLRGGHRFVWGDASSAASFLRPGDPSRGEIRSHTGLAGLVVRASKVSGSLDYEASPGDKSYFRSSLHQYHQVRGRLRIPLPGALTLTQTFHLLDNNNPAAGAGYEFRITTGAWSLDWQPQSARHIRVSGEYALTGLHSDITYLLPPVFDRLLSQYREQSHSSTVLVEWHAPRRLALSAGGSLVVIHGTRPTRYYQPLVRVRAPLNKSVEAFAEWRWYGMVEPLFFVEGFRTHQVVLGLRLTR